MHIVIHGVMLSCIHSSIQTSIHFCNPPKVRPHPDLYIIQATLVPASRSHIPSSLCWLSNDPTVYNHPFSLYCVNYCSVCHGVISLDGWYIVCLRADSADWRLTRPKSESVSGHGHDSIREWGCRWPNPKRGNYPRPFGFRSPFPHLPPPPYREPPKHPTHRESLK